MNQLERDFTYRLDAVKEICEQHGSESQECQQAIGVWELQHNANITSYNLTLYGKFALIILVVFVLGYFLFLKSLEQFTKLKIQKKDRRSR